jgi:hypothetical protein
MVLVIKDIIKGDTAVSTDDGDVVYQKIVAILELGNPVELDFSGINIMTTAFLNAAIGQLYSAFTSEQLNSLLKLVNVAADDRILFKKVIERAKEYFQNKKGFEDSANKAIYGS